jgi:hypothetical protein
MFGDSKLSWQCAIQVLSAFFTWQLRYFLTCIGLLFGDLSNTSKYKEFLLDILPQGVVGIGGL